MSMVTTPSTPSIGVVEKYYGTAVRADFRGVERARRVQNTKNQTWNVALFFLRDRVSFQSGEAIG